MLDFPHDTDTSRVHNASGEPRDTSQSREGDLVSDALGVPLLSDEAAPLSEALHIPTLVGESPKPETPKRETNEGWTSADTRAEFDARSAQTPANDQRQSHDLNGDTTKSSSFDMFGRRRDAAPQDEPQNHNRATTPAGPPQPDAWHWIGVPSNHPQTKVSGRLAKLDKGAVVLGALMTIGPLFAAMIGRMGM